MEPEKDDGNIEYKRQLLDITNDRIETLATQMKYRLTEGDGEAIYEIGVNDDGSYYGLDNNNLTESLSNVEKIANSIKAISNVIYNKEISKGKFISHVLIRKRIDNLKSFIDIKICTLGNVDAGKSSLLSVLTKGELDNGRGSARNKIVTAKHELESGRTSMVGHYIFGFDESSKEITGTWEHVVENSIKIISFVDLAGHEKYLKTTMGGMCGSHPDYALLLVEASSGITEMTKEHRILCLSLKVPFIFVITKVDRAPPDKLLETINEVNKYARARDRNKNEVLIPYPIENKNDVYACIRSYPRSCPYFKVSNVTGEGIDLLRLFLNLVPPRIKIRKDNCSELSIENIYHKHGIGTIVHGLVTGNKFNVNDTIWYGPDTTGDFHQTVIKSIHVKRIPQLTAEPGISACLALRNLGTNRLKRGMVLIKQKEKPIAIKKFVAEIVITDHPTSIRVGYQPIVQVNNIRQSCVIQKIHDDNSIEKKSILRLGEKSKVNMEFVYHHVYLSQILSSNNNRLRFVFREGKTRGYGDILLGEPHF